MIITGALPFILPHLWTLYLLHRVLVIHLDNQIFGTIFTRYCFVIPSSKYREVRLGQGGTGLRKILRQTVEGRVELPKILKDKLLRAGWGGIAENTWTSRGQSSDCQLANLWIGEVETNCRIVFCLVNPPTIKIPHLQAIHRH